MLTSPLLSHHSSHPFLNLSFLLSPYYPHSLPHEFFFYPSPRSSPSFSTIYPSLNPLTPPLLILLLLPCLSLTHPTSSSPFPTTIPTSSLPTLLLISPLFSFSFFSFLFHHSQGSINSEEFEELRKVDYEYRREMVMDESEKLKLALDFLGNYVLYF